MGRARAEHTTDDAYAAHQTYYQKNRARMLATSKKRYAENKSAYKEVTALVRKMMRARTLNNKTKRLHGVWSKDVRFNAREYVTDIKESNPCADCGHHYPFYVMDFDHVRGEKTALVSDLMTRGASLKRLQTEIDKCDLVCSNCHRERTFLRSTSSQL